MKVSALTNALPCGAIRGFEHTDVTKRREVAGEREIAEIASYHVVGQDDNFQKQSRGIRD